MVRLCNTKTYIASRNRKRYGILFKVRKLLVQLNTLRPRSYNRSVNTREMKKIKLDGIHNFRKFNVITLEDNKSQYDLMKCSECGVEGKCRDFIHVEIDGRKKGLAERCKLTLDDFNKLKNEELFNTAKETEIKCKNCAQKLRKLYEWVEEGYNHTTHITGICKCGFNGIVPIKQYCTCDFYCDKELGSKPKDTICRGSINDLMQNK